LQAFREAGFTTQWRQIRRGHFPLVYPIRYGLVPQGWLPRIAGLESRLWCNAPLPRFDYADVLVQACKSEDRSDPLASR
jgi:hypothetical protein